MPADWGDFWSLLVLGVALVFLAAFLAGLDVRRMPINPLRWHLWIITRTRIDPEIYPKSRLPNSYMLAWVVSLCCFCGAALVLVAIVSA